ncbi:hypothetical protein HUJ04_013252 [Dendroctonus ponderosae]|nr:hypothetical protein HUJ04_013252 [Dendroctonus ponderosae]
MLDLPDVMCRLPEMRGHCRALIMRWRYDPETGKCDEFGFGGCDGNSNNFPTRKACMDMCAAVDRRVGRVTERVRKWATDENAFVSGLLDHIRTEKMA